MRLDCEVDSRRTPPNLQGVTGSPLRILRMVCMKVAVSDGEIVWMKVAVGDGEIVTPLQCRNPREPHY